MIPPPETDLHPESMREAGVLYWRRPSSSRGRIFSITLKIFPELTGDGSSSVAQLIDANPRARHLAELYRRRHQASLDRILDEGERFPLVFSGNHCQGTIFKNGTQLATPALEDRIESIAQSIPDFFFGRFDIRFSDFDEFLAGRGFKIIEINGASAEATHIWDAETSLGEAYRVLFEQFSTLFAIGAENRRSGHRPMSMLQFLKTFWKYRRLAKSYPTTL